MHKRIRLTLHDRQNNMGIMANGRTQSKSLGKGFSSITASDLQGFSSSQKAGFRAEEKHKRPLSWSQIWTQGLGQG